MKRLRMLFVALLALGALGCGHLVETAAHVADIPSPAKRVASKAEPDLLIAHDGSSCKVPPARFSYIEVGQSITCVWMDRTGPGAVGRNSLP